MAEGWKNFFGHLGQKLTRQTDKSSGKVSAKDEPATPSATAAAKPDQSAATLLQCHVEGALLFANREELVGSLSKIRNGVIAELGVAFGDFSKFILDELKPQKFDAYDLFNLHLYPTVWGKPMSSFLGDLTHRAFFEQRFAAEIASNQVNVLEGDASTRLLERQDQIYDMVYIDAGHNYESVSRDAASAITRLKPDGILVFNDYIMYDHLGGLQYGVVQVVNELCVNQGWRVTHFAFHPHMFCDIAIQKTN